MAKLLEFNAQQRVRVLEESLQLREDELALLRETSDAVVSQLHLQDLYQLVSERARYLVKAETIIMPVLDSNGTTYTYRGGSGRNAQEMVGETLSIEIGICGWVLQHNRPWWLGVVEELAPQERNRWEHEAQTLILVPLTGKHGILGGIAGMNKIGGGPFTQRDLDLLTLFASQVAIAMENARAFEALEYARQEAVAFQVELQRINRELEQLALYDPVTSLPNRTLIQQHLERELLAGRSEGRPLAVFLLDLNDFKAINDTLGHSVGDILLKMIGERLSQSVPRTDIVGRLGGDEFALLLRDIDATNAVAIAHNIAYALEPPFTAGLNHVSVHGSIGIAVHPQHGADASTLLRHADVAMYVAKRSHQRCFVYTTDDDPYTEDRLALVGALHAAVGARAFTLHYQPKISLADGRIVGMEALARWPGAQGTYTMPDVFIPMLEHSGLALTFTLWALETALRQCVHWQQGGFTLGMAVNLPTHILGDAQLFSELSRLLNEIGMPARDLTLEITEAAIISDSPSVVAFFEQASALGVRFSIDDFGTGYSSLSRLTQLPVRELKIDKSFVDKMLKTREAGMIVESIVRLGQGLGLEITAEGIERPEELARLKEYGCDLAQGYYLCPPLPAADMDIFLANYSRAQPAQ